MARTTFSKEIIDRLNKEVVLAERLNNLHLYKIVTCLLLIQKGKKVSAIAEQLNISGRTLYDRLEKFMARRFSWLLGRHYQGRGRKPRLNEKQKQELPQAVVAGPEACGYDRGFWNSATIVIEIEKRFKVSYSPRYVCSLLKGIGLSCRNAKFIPGKTDDEEWQRQRREWEEKTCPEIVAMAEAKGAVILFGDEVSFAQWGSPGRTRAPKGHQPTIKTSGKRKGLKMFGVIELVSGKFVYRECDGKFNGQSCIAFLEQVLAETTCPVILIEDGAPYHRSAPVKQFKADQQAEHRLFCDQLPNCSPDQTPTEKLWKSTKAEATHCKYFPTFDDLRDAVVTAFNKYLQDVMKVISVMTKLRAQSGWA